MLDIIRTLVYKMGFRPKPGTVLFSPSAALRLAYEDGMKDFNWSKVVILDGGKSRWEDLVDWQDANGETELND
jgi:hypothetical protein